MPSKPKRPCSYPSCPELSHGRYCDKHQRQMDAHYNKYERDPDTSKRYGKNWRKIRAVFIATHPLCETCKEAGRLTPTQEVHHKIPLSKGGDHNDENLLGLCTSCHSSVTAREGGRWGQKY